MQRFPTSSTIVKKPAGTTGSALIAFGLVVLFAALLELPSPTMTGMACIALGATLVVVSRLRASFLLCPTIAAHLLIYASLYLLFWDAVWRVEFAKSQNGHSVLLIFDLGTSVGLMAGALRRAGAAMLRAASP